MPRHKKDYETKQFEGTYRKDRDGTSDQSTMTNQIISVPPAPATLKTEYAREAWTALLTPLCAMKRICEEDIVIIQVAFQSLDDAERYKQKMEIMEDDDQRITSYASLVKNYRQQFVDIMRKYGTTLYDRMTMREILSGMVKRQKSLAEKMTDD